MMMINIYVPCMYNRCVDCKKNWLCRACSTTCHQGHNLVRMYSLPLCLLTAISAYCNVITHIHIWFILLIYY